MNGAVPNEQLFENHIEARLIASGYSTARHDDYDRTLCLIKQQTIDFIQSTQADEWNQLREQFGDQTEDKFLGELAKYVKTQGIIHALRNEFEIYGVHFNLCYFQPKSDLNLDHRAHYKQNKFAVVRQLHYSTRNENSIDMALFLNGLPIATLELKNQLTGQNITHAENQYRFSRDPNEPLLKFKRCAVHFCVDNNRVSMTTRLSGKATRFLPYNKGLENPKVADGYRTEYLWKKVLTPDSLADILENFAHVAEEKKWVFNEQTGEVAPQTSKVLVFPRYHQLNLIRRLRKNVTNDGAGQSYLVQHTTGAGKSYSIGWLAHMLASLYQSAGDTRRLFDTIIVVTDRRVLDDQLRAVIRALAQIKGLVFGVERGSAELQTFLEQGKTIVVTTIQKFPFISRKIADIGDRKFAVIIDEVHSSQSGELAAELRATLAVTDDGDKDADAFDYEKMINKQMENRQIRKEHISYFGFTGTPKEKTLELFGCKTPDGKKPFDTYTMEQSIGEGFTLDVLRNYTTHKRWFKLKQTKEGKDAFPVGKARRALVRYADDHPNTIEYKVRIILNHWTSRGSKEIQGQSRAMIVTRSRKHCVKFVREVNRQLKERGADYRALVGFSDTVTVDGEPFTEYGMNEEIGHRGNVPFGLKNPKYRILVVANKFQTGFDEPLLQCMYVDKRLDGVQCVQTLSRLNRTTKGKTEVFVLDFVNKAKGIAESFQQFYNSTILEGETDPQALYSRLTEIGKFDLYTWDDVERFCKVFFEKNRDEGELHPLLDTAVENFKRIADADEREQLRSIVQSYIRLYGYLAQIIPFADAKLEKSFIFLKYLDRKLPKRPGETVKINDKVELDYLRIQITHEKIPPLQSGDAVVAPPDFDGIPLTDDEHDILAVIIALVNQRFGVNFTEHDKAGFADLRADLENDPETQEFMHGESTRANKEDFFKDQFRKMLGEFFTRNHQFHRTMINNPEMRDFIREQLYENYPK